MVSKTLQHKKAGEVEFFQFPHFNETACVNHCFSTRKGGVSNGFFESMNLGFNRGDLVENVRENFRRLTEAIQVNTDNLVFTDQTHEAIIRCVTIEDKGKGFDKPKDYTDVDGLITNVPELVLTTFYADCVPLYFLDPVKKVIGLSHAGWRGTVKGIGPKTVKAMQETYGSKVEDILVGIGPSIGVCCFEVSEDVLEHFRALFSPEIFKTLYVVSGNPDHHKYKIDLWEANRQLLLQTGIILDKIVVTDVCTQCHSDLLYSHRVMGAQRGSLAALLSLK